MLSDELRFRFRQLYYLPYSLDGQNIPIPAWDVTTAFFEQTPYIFWPFLFLKNSLKFVIEFIPIAIQKFLESEEIPGLSDLFGLIQVGTRCITSPVSACQKAYQYGVTQKKSENFGVCLAGASLIMSLGIMGAVSFWALTFLGFPVLIGAVTTGIILTIQAIDSVRKQKIINKEEQQKKEEQKKEQEERVKEIAETVEKSLKKDEETARKEIEKRTRFSWQKRYNELTKKEIRAKGKITKEIICISEATTGIFAKISCSGYANDSRSPSESSIASISSSSESSPRSVLGAGS